MKSILKILENISFIIIVVIFVSIFFFTKYIPEIILKSIPILFSILMIPRVLSISERNGILKERKILLYIINALFMLCNFILIYLSYFNDDTGYYLLMLYVLLIQGGVTGILIKHVLISRSDTSILDGTPIMYVFNSIFIVLGISLLVYYFMF